MTRRLAGWLAGKRASDRQAGPLASGFAARYSVRSYVALDDEHEHRECSHSSSSSKENKARRGQERRRRRRCDKLGGQKNSKEMAEHGRMSRSSCRMDDKDEHDARGRSCSEAGETRAAFGKSAQAHSVRDLGLLSPRVQFKHLYWAFVFTDSNRFHSRNLLKSELVYQNRLESSRKYNKVPV